MGGYVYYSGLGYDGLIMEWFDTAKNFHEFSEKVLNVY
jgi:hypothetical protein